MEASPLTNAQHSSRSAFAAAKDSSQAQQDHKDAASQYAAAASSTNDSEALRILKLLENQHKELAVIVKSATDHPRLNVENVSATPEGADDAAVKPSDESASRNKMRKRPSSPSTQRKTSREMRTSIASNLASARGIPSVQQRSSGRAETIPEHQSARDSLRHNMSSDAHPMPQNREGSNDPAQPAIETSMQDQPTQNSSSSAPSDYAFQKFYSSVEGIFSALSAPLAFAGLPLTQPATEAVMAPATQSALSKPSEAKAVPTASTPDITKLFSRAALNAVKEDSHSIPMQDSFQIVPTGGGAMSYAKMLSHEERRARASAANSTDNFVDAQETPSRSGSHRAQQAMKSPNLNKTLEELETENASLKKVLNDYSKRLYMWQQSSQRQTQDLHASIRMEAQRARPSESKSLEAGKVDAEKMRELEERVKKLEGELERMGRENEKLKAVVQRYRQRWEELKAGARLRRESPAGGGSAG